VDTHHIAFLREYPQLDTLGGHPFERQFDNILARLPEIIFHVNVLSQSKITDFNDTLLINPAI
jgi:hypothetical protein